MMLRLEETQYEHTRSYWLNGTLVQYRKPLDPVIGASQFKKI